MPLSLFLNGSDASLRFVEEKMCNIDFLSLEITFTLPILKIFTDNFFEICKEKITQKNDSHNMYMAQASRHARG
jgi:hypothetical protein